MSATSESKTTPVVEQATSTAEKKTAKDTAIRFMITVERPMDKTRWASFVAWYHADKSKGRITDDKLPDGENAIVPLGTLFTIGDSKSGTTAVELCRVGYTVGAAAEWIRREMNDDWTSMMQGPELFILRVDGKRVGVAWKVQKETATFDLEWNYGDNEDSCLFEDGPGITNDDLFFEWAKLAGKAKSAVSIPKHSLERWRV
jgi:hypothetical protein